jgi:hypothetical protein
MIARGKAILWKFALRKDAPRAVILMVATFFLTPSLVIGENGRASKTVFGRVSGESSPALLGSGLLATSLCFATKRVIDAINLQDAIALKIFSFDISFETILWPPAMGVTFVLIYFLSAIEFSINNISRYVINKCGGRAIHIPLFYWVAMFSGGAIWSAFFIYILAVLAKIIASTSANEINGIVDRHVWSIIVAALLITAFSYVRDEIKKKSLIEMYGTHLAATLVLLSRVALYFLCVMYLASNIHRQ